MCVYAFTMQHCTYMYVQYYSATTKKKILSYVTTCMDLEGITLCQRKQILYDILICEIKKNLKKNPKSWKKDQTHGYHGEWGTDCMNMVKRYTLPVINKH